LRNAVEAVSLLLHTPHLLPPLSKKLSALVEVLVGCFQAACQATVALMALPGKKERGVTGTADSEKSKEGESKIRGSHELVHIYADSMAWRFESVCTYVLVYMATPCLIRVQRIIPMLYFIGFLCMPLCCSLLTIPFVPKFLYVAMEMACQDPESFD
jgi:hypothetical protein